MNKKLHPNSKLTKYIYIYIFYVNKRVSILQLCESIMIINSFLVTKEYFGKKEKKRNACLVNVACRPCVSCKIKIQQRLFYVYLVQRVFPLSLIRKWRQFFSCGYHVTVSLSLLPSCYFTILTSLHNPHTPFFYSLESKASISLSPLL